MAASVEWFDDGSTTFWQRDFDNDDTSPDFNPNPLVALGDTPIAASLMNAYNDWYIANRTAGGAYELDPLADCRLWYVVLITDGEESCAPTPDSPAIRARPRNSSPTRRVTWSRFPVYVVGFSEGVSASSPIECVASITGGQFYSASNASQCRACCTTCSTRWRSGTGRSSASAWPSQPGRRPPSGRPTRWSCIRVRPAQR
jgi:hypothetical protein